MDWCQIQVFPDPLGQNYRTGMLLEEIGLSKMCKQNNIGTVLIIALIKWWTFVYMYILSLKHIKDIRCLKNRLW